MISKSRLDINDSFVNHFKVKSNAAHVSSEINFKSSSCIQTRPQSAITIVRYTSNSSRPQTGKTLTNLKSRPMSAVSLIKFSDTGQESRLRH